MIEEIKKNAKSKPVLTKFLSPEEQQQLKSQKVLFSSVGNERHRAYLGDEDDVDFQISVLKINYPKKFHTITHASVLGALMGLGITRSCIGDIIIGEEVYVVCIKEMAPFIIDSLKQVGRVHVEAEEVLLEELDNLHINPYIEEKLIVSSMRLDTVVRGIVNVSREKAQEAIRLKVVKLNGVIHQEYDTVLKEGDMVSIHRFGRTVIKEILRKTKKDKIVLLIERTK